MALSNSPCSSNSITKCSFPSSFRLSKLWVRFLPFSFFPAHKVPFCCLLCKKLDAPRPFVRTTTHLANCLSTEVSLICSMWCFSVTADERRGIFSLHLAVLFGTKGIQICMPRNIPPSTNILRLLRTRVLGNRLLQLSEPHQRSGARSACACWKKSEVTKN